jgi:hypothetical protein
MIGYLQCNRDVGFLFASMLSGALTTHRTEARAAELRQPAALFCDSRHSGSVRRNADEMDFYFLI